MNICYFTLHTNFLKGTWKFYLKNYRVPFLKRNRDFEVVPGRCILYLLLHMLDLTELLSKNAIVLQNSPTLNFRCQGHTKLSYVFRGREGRGEGEGAEWKSPSRWLVHNKKHWKLHWLRCPKTVKKMKFVPENKWFIT